MKPVVIIGGGPAGATMGSYLSRAGIPNMLFEGAVHPRPHVGESLVPATTIVFRELGLLDVMENKKFVHKHGAAVYPVVGERVQVRFAEVPQEGVDQDYTYHVDRAEFDLRLLKHAEALGTKVHQGTRVRDVIFDNDRACGVKVELGGRLVDIDASIVVDATGRSSLLGRKLGLRKPDPQFNQFAVHAWFENVALPDDETRHYVHILFLPVMRGWAWLIPITDDITSVGIVAEKSVFKHANKDHAAWFHTHSQSTSTLAGIMAGARRCNDFKVEADYSYVMDRFSGDGYLLIGDAARFVDPIFSSGVSVALFSAKFASECIVDAWQTGDFTGDTFLPYERLLRSGTEIWYEFISLFYRLQVTLPHFLSQPEWRGKIIPLLQGDVYERKRAPALDAMRELVREVENNEAHPYRPMLDTSIVV